MRNEDIVLELASLLSFIDETCEKIGVEYDKFQVALSNTLRLLDGGSPTLAKMKGSTGDLKAYIIRTSTSLRQISLDPYEQLRSKIASLCTTIQSSQNRKS